MNFPSTAAMFSFDLVLIFSSIAGSIIVLRQRARLKDMQAQFSALLVLSGVWTYTSISILNLYSMTLLPSRVGTEKAHSFMVNIHINYAWYAGFVAAILIIISLISFTRRFISHQSMIEQLTDDLSLRNDELSITKQRLDAAVSCANIGVFDFYVREGRSSVSESWKSIMGFVSEDEIDAQTEWLDRVHPEDLPEVREAAADCIAGKNARFETEYRIRTANGTWRWMRSLAAPYGFEDGGTAQRLIGVQFDVTEAKEIEQRKQEFVATVSHELRTPIASIHGSLRLLLQNANNIPTNAIQLLKIADRNADRLMILVNDILEMEKLANEEGEEYNLHQTNIGQLVELAVASIRPAAHAANVQIEFEDHSGTSTTTVEAARLEQVFVNLISNAIKFSPDNGTVDVEVENDADSVRVAVTDRGTGIPPEFSERIFQRFSKADMSNSRNSKGAGLGLYISKRLVEAMGGEIGFQSEPNIATTFWLRFPIDLKESIAVTPSSAA